MLNLSVKTKCPRCSSLVPFQNSFWEPNSALYLRLKSKAYTENTSLTWQSLSTLHYRGPTALCPQLSANDGKKSFIKKKSLQRSSASSVALYVQDAEALFFFSLTTFIHTQSVVTPQQTEERQKAKYRLHSG